MRFLSLLFSLLMHATLALAVVFSGSFTRSVRVDLERPVYEVKLVQRGKPVSLPGVKPIAAASVQVPKPKALTALKPVKVPQEQPKPKPQDVSPKKTAEKKPEKKEPTREEILAQAMKEAKQVASKEKGSERDALKQALGEIQKEVGTRGEPQGHPEGLGDQPTGAVVTYIEYLQVEIRRNWRFPVVGNKDWKATVLIGIDPAGTITNSRLTARSGREDFDASILRAIEQTRLSHPPPGGKAEFEITFHHDDLSR